MNILLSFIFLCVAVFFVAWCTLPSPRSNRLLLRIALASLAATTVFLHMTRYVAGYTDCSIIAVATFCMTIGAWGALRAHARRSNHTYDIRA